MLSGKVHIRPRTEDLCLEEPSPASFSTNRGLDLSVSGNNQGAHQASVKLIVGLLAPWKTTRPRCRQRALNRLSTFHLSGCAQRINNYSGPLELVSLTAPLKRAWPEVSYVKRERQCPTVVRTAE